MRVAFKRSFAKDLQEIRDKDLKKRLNDVIRAVEEAGRLLDVQGVKRLRGSEDYYRIKLGDYRVGLTWDGDSVTFVRFLHRKDIYRYFP